MSCELINFTEITEAILVAAVAEWYRYQTVACFVTGSSPVPLKTRRVGQRCTKCFAEVTKLTASLKIKECRSKIKTIFITFFDSKGIILKEFVPGIILKEFVPTGQTLTGQYFLAVLKRLMAKIHRIRPGYRTQSSWCLLHDNAPSHTSFIVRRL
ncbi:HTH_48 domain-containing protein [Trichonephila clavipes]|nr:HTH_48 domain-containing protein [Trichonephila clavipes]